MEILKEKLIPQAYNPAKDQPFKLPRSVLQKLEETTLGGQQNFHKGYEILVRYLNIDKNERESQRFYWFNKASEINRNDKSSIANQYIRGVNAAAAEYDKREMTPFRQQWLSDQIGKKVISSILSTKTVPPLREIVQQDVLLTLGSLNRSSKNDLSNWAGSYRYWHIPITLEAATRTIGQHIMADKEMRQKFITVQARGAVRVVRSGSLDTGVEAGEIFDQLFSVKHGPGILVRRDIIGAATDRLTHPQEKFPTQPKLDREDGAELHKDKQPDRGVEIQDMTAPEKQVGERRSPLSQVKKVIPPASDPQLSPQQEKNTSPLSTLGQPQADGRRLTPTRKIETLHTPTPEMIARNVFRPDENGLTNRTAEAELWKKNRKLALRLIELAGRRDEFASAFESEDA